MPLPSELPPMIAELGRLIGFSNLYFDDGGALALRFDDLPPLALQYQAARDTLCLYSDLGIPPDPPADLHTSLLRANLFWDLTRGATFMLTEDAEPRVVLAREIAWRGRAAQELYLDLELFVNTLEDWRRLLREGSAAPARAIPADSEPPSLDARYFIRG